VGRLEAGGTRSQVQTTESVRDRWLSERTVVHAERLVRERTLERVREQLAAEPPVIKVTIGRVEVRAVHPSPPQPPPALPPAPSAPSLEEFLARRDRRPS
jgi:hypothetical protein